jgi:hypothetical protein
MSEQLGTLTRRPVHPASPVLLTKNGPLRTFHSDAAVQLSDRKLLTYLKFENRRRKFLSANL